MTDKHAKFVELAKTVVTLCNKAMQQGDADGDNYVVELATAARERFVAMIDQAANGTLPASAGIGLGINKALGEWAPPYLIKAGTALEEFYKKNM